MGRAGRITPRSYGEGNAAQQMQTMTWYLDQLLIKFGVEIKQGFWRGLAALAKRYENDGAFSGG